MSPRVGKDDLRIIDEIPVPEEEKGFGPPDGDNKVKNGLFKNEY